jgi:ribonuclease D
VPPAPEDELRSVDPARVALDVEGDSFYRYGERLCLVQVAFGGRIRVHDPLETDLSRFFAELESRQIILHGSDFDLRLLHARYGFAPPRVFDTMLAARFLNIPRFGLSDLYEKYFGIVLEKKHQRADWCRRPLTAELLEYARQDVAHLEELGERLGAELAALGRSEWHREECESVLSKTIRSLARPPDPEFWRVKGSGSLKRRELSFLKELALARDRIARERDRAHFRVFSVEDLLTLSRLAAADPDSALRRFPRALPSELRREFGRSIERAASLPESDLPAPLPPGRRPDPRLEARVRRLAEKRDSIAKDLDLDPSLLASRAAVARVAEARPGTEEELASVLESRWRALVLKNAFLGE